MVIARMKWRNHNIHFRHHSRPVIPHDIRLKDDSVCWKFQQWLDSIIACQQELNILALFEDSRKPVKDTRKLKTIQVAEAPAPPDNQFIASIFPDFTFLRLQVSWRVYKVRNVIARR